MDTFFLSDVNCVTTLIITNAIFFVLLGLLYRKYQLNKFKLAKYEVKDILMDVHELNEHALRFRLSRRGLSFSKISFALLIHELKNEKALNARPAHVDHRVIIYSLSSVVPGEFD